MGRAGATAVALLAVAAAHLVAFEVIRQLFVETVRGQRADTAALAGIGSGQGAVAELGSAGLGAVAVLSVLVATLVIGFIGLVRGRMLLAATAATVVIGANLTTQVLKEVLERPEWGVDAARYGVGNSLPSGHTTLTAAVVIALVLVVPPAVRGAVAVVGTAVATGTGIATVAAGWHRPSDAVAAVLVVGAWAALAGLVLVLARRRQQPTADTPQAADRHWRASVALATVAGTAMVLAVAALMIIDQSRGTPPELLSQERLLVAYAGGAAGIVAVTCGVVALVLATAHRVVPGRP